MNGTEPERIAPTWRMLLGLIRRLPQAATSRLTGRLADLPLPRPLRAPVFRSFAALAGIDIDEAALPLDRYSTFDSFFIRRLKPGIRDWPADALAIASPVDGTVGQLGVIHEGDLLQAKGRPYSAAALLDDEAEAARFDGGSFLTLYLGPADYHRIHAPLSGSVAKVRHVPGSLLPVNQSAVRHFADLFPRNERVVCYLDGSAGRTAVIAVGAFNVGRIEVVFDGSWRTNRPLAVARDIAYEPAQGIRQADELMIFHLGSTVVLLFEPSRFRLDDAVRCGVRVRLGQVIASMLD